MTDSEPAVAHEEPNTSSSVQGTGRHWWSDVTALVLAGAGLVLLSTAKYGAGISPDSTAYLDVARSLASGRGFVHHTGGPFVSYAPLYPMLLALIGFATRLDPAAFAHLVNAVLFAVVIYLSACLLRAGSRLSAAYSLLGVCVVLFSRPLSEVYAMAWSECLFIPLVLLYLLFAQRYWGGGGMRSIAVMTLSTALACLTRYVGVALVPAGVLTILLATGANLKRRLTRALAFAALSLVPLGLWAARNYRLTETLFGNRGPRFGFTVDNVILHAKTTLLWYVPGRGTKYIVLTGFAIALVAVISSHVARSRVLNGLKAVLADCSPAVILLATYSITLFVASTTGAVVDSRMLSPLYVAVTVVLLKLAYDLLSPDRPVAIAVTSRAPSLLLALWLCFPLTSVVLSTASRLKDGAGEYSTRKWRESETIAYARQMLSVSSDVHVYSNGNEVLWELARVNATRSPDRWTASLAALEGCWPAENGSVLVWLKNITWRKYLFSVEELKEIAYVEEIAHFSDGSVYRVSVHPTIAHD